MAAFEYMALDRNGRRHKGVIEADSARRTRQILRERSLTPVRILEASRQRGSGGGWRAQRAGLRDISVVTRQLAVLAQAGLPVELALQTLSHQSGKPHLKSMLAAVRAQVLEGRTLAQSLAAFPRSFSELYRSSVHAGERTGHLDRVLAHLAEFTEQACHARQKALLALLYPLILSVVSAGILIFMTAFIVPGMIRVYADTAAELPFLTRALICISNGLQAYGPGILMVTAGAAAAAGAAIKQPGMRERLDRRLLRWPVIGNFVRQRSAAHFAATLGMLQESGVPLLQSLDIAAAAQANRHMRERVQAVARQVREGVSLSRAMEQSEAFPSLLITMAGSGEASGQLGGMLTRAGSILQRELENRTAVLLGLFEPLVLLVMGGFVLLLVLAIILPILNLNQLV